MLNASHPERVHAAVVQQIKLPHEACVTRETPNSGNIQVVTVPYFMVRHAAQYLDVQKPQHCLCLPAFCLAAWCAPLYDLT